MNSPCGYPEWGFCCGRCRGHAARVTFCCMGLQFVQDFPSNYADFAVTGGGAGLYNVGKHLIGLWLPAAAELDTIAPFMTGGRAVRGLV